jgi:iron complex outermembrane receptor protein
MLPSLIRSSPFRPALLPSLLLAGLTPWCSAQSPASLPEVTVSASPASETNASTASTTVLQGDDLKMFHVEDLGETVRRAANFSATDSGTGAYGDVLSVRGLGNTVFFGPPAVAVYVDDAPTAAPISHALRTSTISSVELVRGPQPLSGGLNAYGGLINVRTRRPGDQMEGEIQSTVGSYNFTNTSAWLTGPLIKDVLAFRLGGGYESRDGYLKNPDTGARLDSIEHSNVDGALYLTPAEGWEIRLSGAWSRDDDGAPRLTSHERAGFYDASPDHEGRQHRETEQQALRIAYENENWQFLSVTSRRRWLMSPFSLDADYTPEPLGVFDVDLDQETWSQEFRWSSADTERPFQWTAGLFGSTTETDGVNLRTFFTERQDITVTPLALSITLPRLGRIPLPEVEIVAVSDSKISSTRVTRYHLEEETAGFFAGGSWSGWEPFTLHAGARVDWVRRAMERNSVVTTDISTVTRIQPVAPLVVPLTRRPPLIIPVPTPEPFTTETTLRNASPRTKVEEEWTHLTPTAGVEWKLSPDAQVYAKGTHAFKPGGYSAYADDSRLLAFDPEKCWNTEAGLRTQWLGGDLMVNVAGFYNEIRDYQTERGLSLADYVVLNADRAVTYGAEIETLWNAHRRLSLSGSFGWTHAEFKRFTDPVTGASLDGNTLPYAPEWNGMLAADFHLECGFFTRVEYLITGPTTYDDRNRPEFEQGAFGLLNTAIGWRKGPVTVTAYATNLTGEEYYTNINTTLRARSVGAPREYGLRMTVSF